MKDGANVTRLRLSERNVASADAARVTVTV